MKDSKALEVWNKILNMDIGSPNSMYTYELKNKITKEDRDIIEQALQQPTDSEMEEMLKLVDELIEYYIDSERTFMENSTLIGGYDKWQKTVDDNVEKYKTIHKTLTKEDNVPTKSAKDMFEELGYKKFYIEHALVWENEYADSVEFYDGLLYSVDENIKIGMELHKAITQQLKELEK